MIGLEINLRGTAGQTLRRLRGAIDPARLSPAAGRAVRNVVRDHLFRLNQERPNQLGGKRTNFYTGAGRATQFVMQGDIAVVSINQVGIRQRFFGGTIRPKTAKYLTIPVHPNAHGKRAREFDLEVVFGEGGKPIALATKGTLRREVTQTRSGNIRSRNVGRRGEIYYRLVRQVVQQPDVSVLPRPDQTYGAAISAINTEVDRATGRGGQT